MKCSYKVTLLEADGVPYGLVLGYGCRSEHEHGIPHLVDSLSMRKHGSGLTITCSRPAADALFIGAAVIDGESHCVLELNPHLSDQKSKSQSLRALTRRIADFESLWSNLPDEQAYRAEPLRAAWDQHGFVIHARTEPLAQAVATLGASFAAEDLAVAYCGRSEQAALGLMGRLERACLVLVAPGLCPPDVLPALTAVQQARSADGARPARH